MKSNVLISELLGSTLCQHRYEMEWERGEGPWLTRATPHSQIQGWGQQDMLHPPQKPCSDKPVQPCSLRCLCGGGCNHFLRTLVGLGSAVLRRSRWEKPRSRSGVYHALPLITPWLSGVLRPHRACSPRYAAPGSAMATRPACALRRPPRRQTSPASAPPQLFLGRLTLSSQTKAKKWAFERPTKFGRYEASIEPRKKKKRKTKWRVESSREHDTWLTLPWALSTTINPCGGLWNSLTGLVFSFLLSLSFSVSFFAWPVTKKLTSRCAYIWMYGSSANLLLEAWANTSGSLTSSLVVLRCSLSCFSFLYYFLFLFQFFPLCETLSVEPSSKRTKTKKFKN